MPLRQLETSPRDPAAAGRVCSHQRVVIITIASCRVLLRQCDENFVRLLFPRYFCSKSHLYSLNQIVVASVSADTTPLT